jgi:DNA modification methylase
VWDYPGVNTFKNDRIKELSVHPTVKPLALVSDAILDCSNRNSIILDCFGGSGTTLIAAEETQRAARIIELDPKYVDVTINRFQERFGVEAVLMSTGQKYEEVKKDRSKK